MASPQKNVFPGLGLPIKSHGGKPDPHHRIPKGVHTWWSAGVTLREQRMMAFIDTITDKPDWEKKVFDEAIVAKWREEAKVGPDTDDKEEEDADDSSGDEDGDGDGDSEKDGRGVEDVGASASDGEANDGDEDNEGEGSDGGSDAVDDQVMADGTDNGEGSDGADEDDSDIPEDIDDDDADGSNSDSSEQDDEVGSAGGIDTEDVYMSPRMFKFCIAELRDKAARFKETGQVNILDAEVTIVKSDNAVSKTLQEELRSAVKALEDVPDRQKDWHPGSDNMVLDLVHPSLFPIVWGFTRALEYGNVPLDGCAKYTGKGVTVLDHPVAETDRDGNPWRDPSLIDRWGSYQWLPAEVSYSDGKAKITSYINNLHPAQHKTLYSVLERITAATIPLWEESVNGFADRRRIKIKASGSEDWAFPPGLKFHIPGRKGPGSLVDPATDEPNYEKPEDIRDDDEDWWDEYVEWKGENRILVYREPRKYIPQADLSKPATAEVLPRITLPPVAGENLQVIYKLANIHLTPEKPTYAGGTWHVEGTSTESIVASALYYYDQDNITDSHLAFRQSLSAEDIIMIPEQDQYEPLTTFLGIEQEGPAVQPLGKVLTREGRLLVFPNVIQHQVQSFSLQDTTRPGHRKILAMFLIDPYRPILSSAHVPPQRRDWWAEEVRKAGGLDALPNEIFDLTVDLVDDFPMSWEQAVKHREILMKERSALVKHETENMFEETFSFCEH
ncbi:hypothetical protein B0T16DRAFT_136264 [Cercophora newfieldiana]|uniref:Uncharacterized protein n=1 Tax=Cercophora newfieldiana TaxID=92897 RepID=A0AA39YBY7_9PEZI|nr:hypothetical protein B0T16DRAFT_136264 [Cercophora newfieldiana]